ncbi:ATP-binding protein [Streptomyces sp. LP05-1]|uniref:histidine kinase n=1 Tax=Streptomyces pyxinae TaxID=2970734 RepID=A0ABT2CHQ9_9ACTN|nr:ATP-binding protein [Streptomyces sp. LP05-1]MCS0636943.1 ATP-binding protein [Streptomyces sp. LP05-1]
MTSWTTQRWLTAGSGAALAVLLVLAACGAWLFGHSSEVSDRLVDRSTPALIASVRLEGALVDQETGVRGYGTSGNREFLEPYYAGQKQQRDAVERLRVLDAGDAEGAERLRAVLERAERWQSEFARPVVGSPAPLQTARQRAAEGKSAFDALRVAITAQQDHLQAQRDRARADLQHVRTLRNWVFSAIALVVLALMAAAFVGLRRAVGVPLAGLSSDVRRVASGHFDHPVAATGPADIRLLATDVEAMRHRLAEELAYSHRARAQLLARSTELKRSNAELEQFAYVASHDLQEPLRKVASFCQLLERRYGDRLDARGKQYIDFAVDGAHRMQNLINDLLTFSRVGRLHAEDVPVDLEHVLDGVRQSLSLALEETGTVLTHDPLPTVPGDPTQLTMLLQNLISNAVKFRTPGTPPRVRVGVRRTEAGEAGGAGFWELSVSDNGIGIDPEYAEKVFVIFQRLHTRDQYPGNGIGLALCKKIADYHGGGIRIDPDHSPGTRFVVTLAASREDAH